MNPSHKIPTIAAMVMLVLGSAATVAQAGE